MYNTKASFEKESDDMLSQTDTPLYKTTLNREHFYIKKYGENAHQKLVPDPFLTLVNNPKQLLHTQNYFKNKILLKIKYFERGLSKKP